MKKQRYFLLYLIVFFALLSIPTTIYAAATPSATATSYIVENLSKNTGVPTQFLINGQSESFNATNTSDLIDINSSKTTYETLATIILRAEEYINQKKCSNENLYRIVQEKNRISDLQKLNSETIKKDVVIVFSEGIMVGKSNGQFTHDRTFRIGSPVSENEFNLAKEKLLNPKKRTQISPDGQVIRTTNLPKNAADYDYILESFPNEMYEKEYCFLGSAVRETPKHYYAESYKTTLKKGNFKKIDKYWYKGDLSGRYYINEFGTPKDLHKIAYIYTYYPYKGNSSTYLIPYKYILDDYSELFCNMASKSARSTFGINYKKLDKDWETGFRNAFSLNNITTGFYSPQQNERNDNIVNYTKKIAKKQQLVAECKVYSDPSFMYLYDEHPVVRTCVKFRINSAKSYKESDLIMVPSKCDDNDRILKKGKWYTYYIDYKINLDTIYRHYSAYNIGTRDDSYFEKTFECSAEEVFMYRDEEFGRDALTRKIISYNRKMSGPLLSNYKYVKEPHKNMQTGYHWKKIK